HAGVGRYDLSAPAANKTGEYKTGIGRLLAQDPDTLPGELRPYLAAVKALNGGGGLRWYPGSPRLVRSLLRRQDRLVAIELHAEDAATLAALFERDPQVKVQQMDGYGGLKALLPPRERRGLVLIDPPFEERDEFERLVQGLRQAYRRWATGHYVIWYPIKDRVPVAAFHDALKAMGIARILTVELLLRPADDAERLNGCGLVLVNPPWPIEDRLRKLRPALATPLGTEPGGGARVAGLVPEQSRGRRDPR